MPSRHEVSIDRIEPPANLNIPELRQNLVRILFIHHSPADVERCLHELQLARFTVSSDTVATPYQFTERLRLSVYDIVVSEYPTKSWKETKVLDLLHKTIKDIPVIFLVYRMKRESVAEFVLKGAADCIEMESLFHLPVAVHRALTENSLRGQRDRAERDLGRSEARYRALVGNLSYGICRCDLDGQFLEVNDAMMKMLGCESSKELATLDFARDAIHDPDSRARLLGQSSADVLVDPIEIEWKRKDHLSFKFRLSGREILSEQGQLEGYEVIVEDVTKQRELEDHLRRQAARDPLTGLANYRHFVDVLNSEIKRSMRTNREFALLFFDLDGLKEINDRYGHVEGSNALCRLADALCSCSRDIDTAARFGGDEFALILPETNADTAGLVSQRVRERVSKDSNGPNISVSVGIAVYPRDGHTIETLLRAADSQLYLQKGQRIRPDISKHAVDHRETCFVKPTLLQS
jgi:diguanylate cyclase (GGDEF)-like protein/PAS domain S-box-containing protein